MTENMNFRSGPRHPDGQATLLIRNLPWTVDPEWVRTSFEQFGPVENVYLPQDFQTGNRKGFGFVKFKHMEDAGEAEEAMNQACIGGREIHITIITDHRVPHAYDYVNGERGRLEFRRDSRGINKRHPPSASSAGRFVRHVPNRSMQSANEYGRENGADEEGWTMVGRRQEPSIRRSVKGGYGGQNGNVEFGGRGRVLQRTQMHKGVCFKCLGRGHSKEECRDPIVCRKCRRVGHYEKACQLGAVERREDWDRHMGVVHDHPRVACLVGEIVEGEVGEEELFKAVKAKYPKLAGAQVKRLENDEILIRQISSTDCIELCGGQQMIGKAKIQWKRIIWTAKVRETMTRPAIIDVRGIPATIRSERNMAAIVKPFGRLRGIITTGLESGDPDLTVLDVEMEEEGTLRPIIIQSCKGMVALKVSERQPPAPPVEGEVERVGRVAAGRGDEHGNGEEAMVVDGGKVTENGLGAEIRVDSKREKGESSGGSTNPMESAVVSKVRRPRRSQRGEGGRTSSRQSRLRGTRLVKGDIIRRHIWYERRKLFIKGDGGEKIWLAVGKGGKMRVPTGWRMVRAGDMCPTQVEGTEGKGEGSSEMGGEESATFIPETIPATEEEEDVRRAHMGECGGFINSQMSGRGMLSSP